MAGGCRSGPGGSLRRRQRGGMGVQAAVRTTLWGSWFWCMMPAVLLTIGLAVVALRTDWETNQRIAATAQHSSSMAQARLQQEAKAAEDYVLKLRDLQTDDLKRRLKEQVDLAHDVMTSVYERAKGQMPDAAVAALIRESLRDARFFQGRGYYFIDDIDGTSLLLPVNPALESSSLKDKRDDTGVYSTREILKIATTPPYEGYLYYRWPSLSDRAGWADKLSYVRQFEPLHWVVGAGDYLPDLNDQFFAMVSDRIRAIHFGMTGGIGMLSVNGTRRLLPEIPNADPVADANGGVLNGTGKPDAQGQAIIALLLNKGRAGGGPVDFQWLNPGSGHLENRIAWVQPVFGNGDVVYASMSAADVDGLPDIPESLSHFLSVIVGLVILTVVAQGICVWRVLVMHRRERAE